jgi:cytochrome c oxidase subunit 2
VIAVPSFRLLYKQDIIPKADVTIKAIGYQWYWGYEYPDQNIAFDANMIETKNLKPNQPRLLETDNHVVVPVNKVVKVLITANDVLHAWQFHPLGLKEMPFQEELMKLGLKLKKKECIMVNVQSYVDLDMHSCQSL